MSTPKKNKKSKPAPLPLPIWEVTDSNGNFHTIQAFESIEGGNIHFHDARVETVAFFANPRSVVRQQP